jgi:hypothetical protein
MAVNLDFCTDCSGSSAHEAELSTFTRIAGEETHLTIIERVTLKSGGSRKYDLISDCELTYL